MLHNKTMKKTQDKKSGFTFIEILVVATIISVLASIGMVSYRSANQKSRDGKRKADIEQIRAALEMYRADDVNGYYPANLSSLTPTYIQTLPAPPKAGDCGSGNYNDCYTRTGSSQYTITITLEAGGSYSKTNP